MLWSLANASLREIVENILIMFNPQLIQDGAKSTADVSTAILQLFSRHAISDATFHVKLAQGCPVTNAHLATMVTH